MRIKMGCEFVSWMGHQIKIMTNGQPTELCITGQYRPAELGLVENTVASGTNVSRYQIAQGEMHILNLPAHASVVLPAGDTFVPDQFIYNGDQRSLSVTISLTPADEISQEK
jgi:hypothetical protein